MTPLRCWRRARAAVGISAAALFFAAGCTSEPNVSSATGDAGELESATLPAISLPDLSPMEKSVRQQMEERFRSLTSLIANRQTPAVELARAYGEMGNFLMAAEYFDAAESFYLHAQSLEPDEMRWPYYLAHVYKTKGDTARSITSFERARRLRPADLATLVWLGNAYLDRGEPRAAEPLFLQALSLQPRLAAALFGLGQVALATGAYSRAIEQFEQVLSVDPRASIAHYPLALAYRGVGDIARAEAHLRQQGSVEIGPPDPLLAELRPLLHGAVAEETRGIRALDTGDFRAAVTHFSNAVELAPDNAPLRHKLGTALSLVGDTGQAFEQFQETVRRSPRFAPAHYSLGILLAASGRDTAAIERFTAAVSYEPDYVEARLQLAEAFRRTGQLEKAKAEYQRVLTIDPRVADAEQALAQLEASRAGR